MLIYQPADISRLVICIISYIFVFVWMLMSSNRIGTRWHFWASIDTGQCSLDLASYNLNRERSYICRCSLMFCDKVLLGINQSDRIDCISQLLYFPLRHTNLQSFLSVGSDIQVCPALFIHTPTASVGWFSLLSPLVALNHSRRGSHRKHCGSNQIGCWLFM